MIRKLKRLMIIIKTGRNWLLTLIFAWLLTGCWEMDYDNYYQAHVKNDTSDTILLLLGKDDAVYYVQSFIILPGKDTSLFAHGHGVRGVNDNEDPINVIFNGGFAPFNDQARVYRHDSLKVTWVGPGREMPDSIHHFYNYNSWDSWLLDEKLGNGATGIVMFTFLASDVDYNKDRTRRIKVE